jgi:hypothetical protein
LTEIKGQEVATNGNIGPFERSVTIIACIKLRGFSDHRDRQSGSAFTTLRDIQTGFGAAAAAAAADDDDDDDKYDEYQQRNLDCSETHGQDAAAAFALSGSWTTFLTQRLKALSTRLRTKRCQTGEEGKGVYCC